jgi:tRNA A-37 threonylcarbamoyl transferase component Bud32/tetratricopeptide (TPR) repeat protein
MSLKTVGRYRVVEVIGHGAMGEVHKAFDPVLKRNVAIKMLTAQHGLDEDMRRRFEREAQSAAQLNHPNIITVYELGEENGNTFIAMELLAGLDLKEMIGTPVLRDLGERLRIMDQVLAGVAFAHDRGVVHRDLKPANIRVLPNGQIKVVDFGLARMSTGAQVTQAGMILGTPHYMSPEQVQGDRADAAADVFALGAVFYEVLTGKRAFFGDNLHTILGKVLTQDPEPLLALSPEVPAAVEAVVTRALSKDRRDRYANAGEMRAALHAAVPSLAPAGRPRPGPGRSAGQPTGAGASASAMPAHRPSEELDTYQDAAPTYLAIDTTPRSTPPVDGDERRSRLALLAGLGIGVVVAGAAVSLVVTSVRTSNVAPRMAATPEPFDKVLREQFVDSLVQLGRVSLENKEYTEAVDKAEQALKEDPGSTAAREILGQAQAAIQDRDRAAAMARQALARGDMNGASAALTRLLALDPRHPAVPELSAALNARFRDEARKAREAALTVRAEATAQQAAGLEGFGRADALVTDGDGLLRREEYVAAAQKFAEARDLFGRAQRAAQAEAAARRVAEAEAARRAQRAAAVAPTPPPPVAHPPSVVTLAPPTAAPVTVAPVTHPPAAVAAASPDPAIRRVLADYSRAIESKDIALFRSTKPNLSESEQKKLEQAFRVVKSQTVGITVDAIEVAGDRAVVRVVRKDVVNGQAMQAVPQVFHLARTADGWKIESIGQ